ncbi:terminase gpA endonuclease subunit [Escherichia coli]|uniref:terminase gpA endonuclease subunit n=1 Tax=Escherichia coli TaxID=562 RepID=UPI00332F0D66
MLTAEQEYETTGSEETLKICHHLPTGITLSSLQPAWSNEKVNCLSSGQSQFLPRSVPDGVNFLVATVDVQAGRQCRFVVQVTGHGSRGERWIIDRYNITQSLRGDSDGES